MSAGAFLRTKYQASYGAGTAIHPIRIQPETQDLVAGGNPNDPPAGDITNPISAVVSLPKRGLGLHPRSITVQTPLDGQLVGYKAGGYIKLPILTEALWAGIGKGDIINYLDVDCAVVSIDAEVVK